MAHIVVAIPAVKDDDLPETLKHLYALSSLAAGLDGCGA